jgi:hypothetical protein
MMAFITPRRDANDIAPLADTLGGLEVDAFVFHFS